MYRRTTAEKIRRLQKEIAVGNVECVYELLSLYKKYEKKKEYLELLSTLRPLNDREVLELSKATWTEFFQQARIFEAQNVVDEDLLQEAMSLSETDNLERVHLPTSGVICWHCVDCCSDFDNSNDRCKFTDVIKFIKEHKECVET